MHNDPVNCVDLWGLTASDKPVLGGNLPDGVLPIISSVPEGSGFLGKLGSFALQGLAGIYNIGANFINNAANAVSYVNEGIDEVNQTLFGASTDEMLMTMQANGILIPTVQQIDNFSQWLTTTINNPSTNSVFWSGFGDDGAYAMYQSCETGGTSLEMWLVDNGVEIPEFASLAESNTWWAEQSQAFAERAIGDVTVYIGQNINANSFFNTIELPALMNNPNVTGITIIPVK